MLVAVDNADGNGFNASVQPPCAMAIHGDSSQRVAEEASLQLAQEAVCAQRCVAKHLHGPHREQLLCSE